MRISSARHRDSKDRLILDADRIYRATVNTLSKSSSHGERRLLDYLTNSLIQSGGHQPNSKENLSQIKTIRSTKILDATGLEDDFYLHLLDWSHALGGEGLLAVGIGDSVGWWDASSIGEGISEKSLGSKNIYKLYNQNDKVTSIRFNQAGGLLACGTNDGRLEIVDIGSDWRCITKTLVSKIHTNRTGVISWNGCSRFYFASGSRDCSIQLYDIRIPRLQTSKWINAHEQEVCGLQWSPDGSLLASGGNDNCMFIWDPRFVRSGPRGCIPVLRMEEHNAAVKGIAWSPRSDGLIASGGGTADRSIRIWSCNESLNFDFEAESLSYGGSNMSNSYTESTVVKSIISNNTSSQVCNLVWSPHNNELISSQGFSENQCYVWDPKTLQQKMILSGHTQRVLYMALSADGKKIATGSGDSTIRVWKLVDERPTMSRLRI